MRPHKKLDVWEAAMKLVEVTYRMTSKFPKDEIWGLISQMKRASVSVVSNIAEGCGRRNNQEKIQFFNIARGSLSELDAQIEISLRLAFISKEEYHKTIELLERVSMMLQGLIRSRN